MLRIGLIGYGYWGPNLARNFHANRGCKLVRVADVIDSRRELGKTAFPGIETCHAAEDVIRADDVDVVVIATPVMFHFELAKAALREKKHVWIEKPITSRSSQAKELTELSESQGLTLMVDHTFLFTSAVRKMKELIVAGELGDL